MIRRRTPTPLTLIAPLGAALAACGGGTEPNPPPTYTCPTTLPQVTVGCSDPACNATTGTKAFALADLDSANDTSWLVIGSLASELYTNETVNLNYLKSTTGALTARIQRARPDLRARVSAADYETLFGAKRRARLMAEERIRAASIRARPQGDLRGTGVRVRLDEKDETLEQNTTCTAASPSCGESALCVIPAGSDEGTCSSALTLKWRDQSSPGQYEDVAATVRKVGALGAIVTDDADTISDADVAAILERFETHIGPLDHAFFGEPRDAQGKDRDQNGVVIFFLTSKVGGISANLAGFFQATDLQDPTQVPSSNGADMLYIQPPTGEVNIENISGTIAHEYQHLIGYYAKVINRQSSPEERWLDEGISTFAEDVTGYGADAFKNIAAYLATVGETSLTGFGLTAQSEDEADSLGPRRGMAHLLVRYLFEQKGAATFPGAGQVTDAGGVAAVKALVQSPSTGIDLFTAGSSGRSFATWMQDLLTVVAIDGANYKDVSCNPAYTLGAVETDAYTGYPRGIDLRTSMVDFSGATIPLNGPVLSTFEAEDVPVPANGGEVRTLATPSGVTRVGIAADATLEDYTVGLRVLPIRQ
ncbi:MAG: hypothetical protein KC933_25435 [Myxococcales bacterium]|nr:hypothetical protein [Myxococcales bacterium]